MVSCAAGVIMAWDCPHNLNGTCQRRQAACAVLAPGCVLRGQGLKRVVAESVPPADTGSDACR